MWNLVVYKSRSSLLVLFILSTFLLNGQRLVNTFEDCFNGVITEEGHIVTTSSEWYNDTNAVKIYRNFRNDLELDEEFYLHREDSAAIFNIFTSESANALAMHVGEVFSNVTNHLVDLVVYKKHKGDWTKAYSREANPTNDEKIHSEVIDFLDHNGDTILISNIVLPFSGIVTKLLVFNENTGKYVLTSERKKQVSAIANLSQKVIFANEIWLGYTTFTSENDLLIYEVNDKNLSDGVFFGRREEFQTRYSLLANNNDLNYIVKSNNYRIDSSPDNVTYTSTLVLLKNDEEGKWEENGSSLKLSKDGFNNVGLQMSNKADYLLSSYSVIGGSVDDTLSLVRYCKINDMKINVLYTFSYFDSERLKYGGVGEASISEDGRYVLVKKNDFQQLLYDMSNLMEEGEVPYYEQKSILYPNPVGGSHITISNPHYAVERFSIYNNLKQLVSSGDYIVDNQIDVSKLTAPGPYILLLEYDTGYREMVRFIVQR